MVKELIVKYNELTAEQFIELWQAVGWGEGPALEQTRLAMEHTLFRVSIFDGDKIIVRALIASTDGKNIVRDSEIAPLENIQDLGKKIAARRKKCRGKKIGDCR